MGQSQTSAQLRGCPHNRPPDHGWHLIEIHKVRAHIGVAGNTRADTAGSTANGPQDDNSTHVPAPMPDNATEIEFKDPATNRVGTGSADRSSNQPPMELTS